MRVSVIGAGYVGLVSGVCLADRGHDVICVDVNLEKVARINDGVPPIFEAGLEEVLGKHVQQRLVATTDLPKAVADTEITLICVGTPSHEGRIDLSHVVECTRQVGEALRAKADYHVVAVKSTVVPGTTDTVVLPALMAASGKRAGRDVGVGVNPEFLTEGQAVSDFMAPDRIVLGGIDPRTIETLERLYESFADTPIVRVSNGTAEMIKYASNCMLATQISFANEIANLCSSIGGIDVAEVMRGVHLSHYLQPRTSAGERVRAPVASFLEAGCGFGGSCLPKDVKALIAHGEQAGAPMRVLRAVLETNAGQPLRLIELLDGAFPSLSGVEVSVLGLAFKPDTDDMRESPSIPIIRELCRRGARVRAYDPVANDAARRVLADVPVDYCQTLEQAIDSARAAVLVTRWSEFQRLPELVERRNPGLVVVDGRRVLDPSRFAHYRGIGLAPASDAASEPTHEITSPDRSA